MDLNRRLPPIDNSRFAMIPRADIPRSTFVTTHSYKSTFDMDYLLPIYVDECVPGDSFHGQLTIFARLNTLLFPLMDRVELETFFFFVPNRLLWDNWRKFQGERTNPADSISYTVPQLISNVGGFPVGGLADYFGLPTAGQLDAGATVSVNALPLRAYNLIWNTWFRDENLQNSATVQTDNGPDNLANYARQKRNKKHDYFTSALPWPQKGGVDVTLPLSGTANILGLAWDPAVIPVVGTPGGFKETGGGIATGWAAYSQISGSTIAMRISGTGTGNSPLVTADLSTATGASINALRLAIQTQRLLERDARGGTRYTEIIQSHFGVFPQDARLQRPEYIGGGKSDFQTQAIPQTSATGLTGGSTPTGALAAQSLINDHHSFSYHAPEHGYIIGLCNVRGELTYQQGLHRMWTRLTRYDFYMPVFAHLGEQAIRNDEIYCRGTGGTSDGLDAATFGYQERWAEYRYHPSRVTGLMRSTSTGNVDEWHLAEQFSSRPALNSTFIQTNTPASRVLAAGASANGQQIIFDSVFKIKRTRPMPMFSVPGMMDHF